MTAQLAVNTSVVIDEAARLEAAGYHGDAQQFVEQLLLRAFTAGWRPIEPPPPPRGPGADPTVQAAAMAEIRETLRARSRR